MDPQKPKTTAKDFFLNLGVIIALFTFIGSLLSILFTVIDKAFGVQDMYAYLYTSSISFPTAVLIIFFPIYLGLSYMLENSFAADPTRRDVGVRKWLSYITLFIAGLTFAGDLVTILYYFLNGNSMTMTFIAKVFVLLLISLCVFWYYLSDVRGMVSGSAQKGWMTVAIVVVLGSLVWGFSVLGSPYTQRALRFDEQRASDLRSLQSYIENYYGQNKALPQSLGQLAPNTYTILPTDPTTKASYEYTPTTATSYSLCATFEKEVKQPMSYYGDVSWNHPAGHYCFQMKLPTYLYTKTQQ